MYPHYLHALLLLLLLLLLSSPDHHDFRRSSRNSSNSSSNGGGRGSSVSGSSVSGISGSSSGSGGGSSSSSIDSSSGSKICKVWNPVVCILHRMGKIKYIMYICTSRLHVSETSGQLSSSCTQNYVHKSCGRDLAHSFHATNFLLSFCVQPGEDRAEVSETCSCDV